METKILTAALIEKHQTRERKINRIFQNTVDYTLQRLHEMTEQELDWALAQLILSGDEDTIGKWVD
jgi:hypothetical protein